MVTDRLLTAGGIEVDPDSNKNVVFGDKNGVASLAYTGLAYIGSTPTDRWIAETLTGLPFPEGSHGPGSVPALMFKQYRAEYLRVRLQTLQARLQELGKTLDAGQTASWTAHPFDVVVSGYEW